LKELRAREGYNQTQLAKKAGISRQTVSLIERNDIKIDSTGSLKIRAIFIAVKIEGVKSFLSMRDTV
jgi:putative transcriptional regulator